MHKFAFIVNTFQRPIEILQDCIISLENQCPKDSLILIVDQNEIPIGVRFNNANIIHRPFKSISTARNHGVKAVEAEWYIFIDDDGVIGTDSISVFINLVENQTLDIVGGKVIIKGSKSAYSVRQNINSGYLSFISLKAVMGGLLAVKRDCFLELNGFDERFGIGSTWGSGEESDFAIRAYLIRKKIFFEPSFFLIHPSPERLQEFKIASYATGKGALIRKLVQSNWHPLLILEILDTFLFPIVEGIFYLISFKARKAKRSYLKIKFRIKGFKSFH
jgi:GT2 family glycosyltransferase